MSPAADRLFDVLLPADDLPVRAEVRAWLAAHPAPTGDELLDSGYMLPRWAPPWGRGFSGEESFVVDEELRRAGVSRPQYPLARAFVGPLILAHGTPAQRERYLRPMLSHREIWCELFSEPDAGSDLASLRTRAVRDADGYLVDGQKIWTSHANESQFGLLLARTDPDAAKHAGISCFVVPMDAPGVTLTPLHTMDGFHYWDAVTFESVRLPADSLVGEEGGGWGLAMQILANERLMMSTTEGLVWGEGPTFRDLLRIVGAIHGADGPPDHLAQSVADGFIDATALHVMCSHALLDSDSAGTPEVRRALADQHGQSALELWRELHGAAGAASQPLDGVDGEDLWVRHYFDARSITLGGGTTEIQRNIIAERVLGLPKR